MVGSRHQICIPHKGACWLRREALWNSLPRSTCGKRSPKCAHIHYTLWWRGSRVWLAHVEDQKGNVFKEKKRARFVFGFHLQGWGGRRGKDPERVPGQGRSSTSSPSKVKPLKSGVLPWAVTLTARIHPPSSQLRRLKQQRWQCW